MHFRPAKTHHSMKDISTPVKDYLRDQVDRYESLPVYKSYKGIAALYLSAPFLIYLLVYLFISGKESILISAIGAGILNLPTALFVYKGNKVALVMALILNIWGLKDVFVYLNHVIETNGEISSINLGIAGVGMVVWYLFLRTTFRAYKVEKMRSVEKNIR